VGWSVAPDGGYEKAERELEILRPRQRHDAGVGERARKEALGADHLQVRVPRRARFLQSVTVACRGLLANGLGVW
jgi:hypothetical protein